MAEWTEGQILGFDLETTGVNPQEDLPVSFSLVYYNQWARQKAVSGLINPGVPIPEQAIAVHGITDEMAQSKGRPLFDSISAIANGLVMASERGIPVVGMNVGYDLQMIDAQAQKLLGQSLFATEWTGPAIDILVIDRHADRYRKGGRKLVDLCNYYGVPGETLHDASSDVEATVAVLSRQVQRYPELAKLTLRELHQRQREWHREWAENFSRYLVSQGKEPLDKSEFSWPLRSV
ncbi:MAG: exonuclease domain-containing protein [Actinomycetota bacterium]|jgi:DNA polymerase-3 subunit epsilon|nr:exonuclease domain-containing protein [Actinomycetota bacterium]